MNIKDLKLDHINFENNPIATDKTQTTNRFDASKFEFDGADYLNNGTQTDAEPFTLKYILNRIAIIDGPPLDADELLYNRLVMCMIDKNPVSTDSDYLQEQLGGFSVYGWNGKIKSETTIRSTYHSGGKSIPVLLDYQVREKEVVTMVRGDPFEFNGKILTPGYEKTTTTHYGRLHLYSANGKEVPLEGIAKDICDHLNI